MKSLYIIFLKSFIDFFIALMALILFSPIIVVILIILSFVNNGSPLFFQERPGKNGKIFKVIKFKTMRDMIDDEGNPLPDNLRLTSFGKFVRKSSLDELPQLINVLKGEMSLVGPRPMLPEYLPLYSEKHKKRHDVRPGITGLAQVKGRNIMKFSERFDNDVFYVENLSFLLDMKIILMTIKSVFFQSSKIVHGQTVDEIDDLGISKNLSRNHFKREQ